MIRRPHNGDKGLRPLHGWCPGGKERRRKKRPFSFVSCSFSGVESLVFTLLIVQSKPVDCVVVSDSFLPRLDFVVGRQSPLATINERNGNSKVNHLVNTNTIFRTSTTTGTVTTPTPPTTTSLYQHQEHRPGLSTAMIYPRCRCL